MKDKIKNLIKNSIKFLKESFQVLKHNFILLLGTGLFIYGLFSFDSHYFCGEGDLIITTPRIRIPNYENYKCIDLATYYYYDDTSLVLLTIGAIFIIIGLIKLKSRNSE